MTKPNRLHLAADTSPGAHRTDSLDAIYWWTPTLGPTAAIAAAHLAAHSRHHSMTAIQVADLRAMLGLGQLTDRFWRTLDRLERYGVIAWHSTDMLTVRTELPELSERQLEGLPPVARAAYSSDLGELPAVGKEPRQAAL